MAVINRSLLVLIGKECLIFTVPTLLSLLKHSSYKNAIFA